MDYTALGRQIRRRRKMVRFTQMETAARAGISVSFYCHVERGRRKPSLETLLSIAKVLGCGLDELVSDDLPSALCTKDLWKANRLAVSVAEALRQYNEA